MVAELLDQLKPEEKKQAMAMLAARYGLTIKDPPAVRPGGTYCAKPRRRY